jgi:hypothetical protein
MVTGRHRRKLGAKFGALPFTLPWRGEVDARSALRIPESPRTPPRAPSVRDPPPPGEGEVNAFSPCKHHQFRISLRSIRATFTLHIKREAER